MPKRSIHSPLGCLVATEIEGKLTELSFSSMEYREETPLLLQVERELQEYFNHQRTTFDVPLEPHGTDFQKRIWAELLKIPFGQTKSYKEVAESIGNPQAMRAVGGACGKNPIILIIPCHRVLGANQRLGGFSAGLDRKEDLLDHEDIPYHKR